MILEKKAAAYYCPDCGHVIAFYKTKFLAVRLINFTQITDFLIHQHFKIR